MTNTGQDIRRRLTELNSDDRQVLNLELNTPVEMKRDVI